MKVQDLIRIIGADFYTGVPDSQLKALCNYLMDAYGVDPKHHIIAANEGNAVALAAGYYLANGKVPVVYMQNSGEGNVINPVASLLNEHVYAIPVIFIVGWRGEPNVHDEPQHVYQGQVTVKLLEDMDIATHVIGSETDEDEVEKTMDGFRKILDDGKSVAFVIRKGALSDAPSVEYKNENKMIREMIIQHIVNVSREDPIISTTGKASRELFETRVSNGQSHDHDFLTVGSMGHSSSIALGVALNKPEKRVWCIDGDGAVLMHMGSLAVIGANRPKNLIHIVINNFSHETVGGMPTVAGSIDLVAIAKACGYPYAVCVDDYDDLDKELEAAKKRNELSLIEARCSVGARKDLGRPTMTPLEIKEGFMNSVSQ
ncbi:MAG: phosphonopyruvate decarboxylase [Lachnospiraceae bacterium]|nr:phosphonopyruvate decarboxylase [Lachnospiraceae bacterium]